MRSGTPGHFTISKTQFGYLRRVCDIQTMEKSRNSKRYYDHRIKEEIIRTKNPRLFPELNIPISMLEIGLIVASQKLSLCLNLI